MDGLPTRKRARGSRGVKRNPPSDQWDGLQTAQPVHPLASQVLDLQAAREQAALEGGVSDEEPLASATGIPAVLPDVLANALPAALPVGAVASGFAPPMPAPMQPVGAQPTGLAAMLMSRAQAQNPPMDPPVMSKRMRKRKLKAMENEASLAPLQQFQQMQQLQHLQQMQQMQVPQQIPQAPTPVFDNVALLRSLAQIQQAGQEIQHLNALQQPPPMQMQMQMQMQPMQQMQQVPQVPQPAVVGAAPKKVRGAPNDHHQKSAHLKWHLAAHQRDIEFQRLFDQESGDGSEEGGGAEGDVLVLQEDEEYPEGGDAAPVPAPAVGRASGSGGLKNPVSVDIWSEMPDALCFDPEVDYSSLVESVPSSKQLRRWGLLYRYISDRPHDT